MRLPSPLRRRIAGLALLAALLLAVPAAEAAPGLSLPVPQPGQLTIGTAKSSKPAALRVSGALPKDVVVVGGIRRRHAVVALVRPAGGAGARGTGRVVIKARGARLTAPAVLTRALTTQGAGLGAACPAAPAALGKVLRRSGATRLTARDVKRLGAVVAGALCGTGLDAAARSFLTGERLTVPPAAPSPAPTVPAGSPGSGPVVVAPAAPAAPARPQDGQGGEGGEGGVAGACDNGKDDDGDGQIDHVNSSNALVDPGCLGAQDRTEDSEKTLSRGCGLGIYTKDTKQGFGVDFDSLSFDHCPKDMRYGIVDLPVAATSCADARWEGTPGGDCVVSAAGNVVVTGAGGAQWDVTGQAASSLCGLQGFLYGYTRDGSAWEQAMPVFDGAEVCAGGPAVAACANGIDDDADGQADVAGGAGLRADPGCDTAADTSEDSEISGGFGEGCAAVIAFDPDGDRRVAFPMLLPYAGSTCPVVHGAWAEISDGIAVTACEQAYFGGLPAGSCAAVAGGVVSTGGSGSRWGADVRLSKDATCSMVGRIAIRVAGGVVREGAALPAVVTQDGVAVCP